MHWCELFFKLSQKCIKKTMAVTCEESIQRSYHIDVCPARVALAEPSKSADAVAASSLDLSLLPAIPPSLKGTTRFQHYESVLKAMQSLKRGCGANLKLEFRSPTLKYRAMQDVMEILFFEPVVEDLLIESGFYSHNIHLHGKELLVIVMAYDFIKYKCSFRPPRSPDNIVETVYDIAIALWDHRVKLNATWSRMRVTASAQYPIQLLPVNKLEQLYKICTMPLYCRLVCSQNDNSWSSVSAELAKLGISLVSTSDKLSGRLSAAVCKEGGIVALSSECRQFVYDSSVRQGPLRMFYPQDIASIVCINKLTHWFKSLQDAKKDVIITNCDKGGTIAGHISSLINDKGSKVFMFGVPPVKMKNLEDKFEAMTVENIHLIPAQFKDADPTDDLFSSVAIIFCNPPSTLSAVHQPIDYIMQEGEENIGQLLTKTQSVSFATLEREQADVLSRAMKFKQAQHVAYFTRSNIDRENDDLVTRVMKSHLEDVDESDDQEWAGFELDSDSACKNKGSNGFLCSFKPAPPKPSPTASEVITKAIELGVLDPNGVEGLDSYITGSGTSNNNKAKKKPSKKRIFSQHNGIPLTFSAKQKVVQRVKKKDPVDFNRQPKPFL